jgi:hypothetical protein
MRTLENNTSEKQRLLENEQLVEAMWEKYGSGAVASDELEAEIDRLKGKRGHFREAALLMSAIASKNRLRNDDPDGQSLIDNLLQEYKVAGDMGMAFNSTPEARAIVREFLRLQKPVVSEKVGYKPDAPAIPGSQPVLPRSFAPSVGYLPEKVKGIDVLHPKEQRNIDSGSRSPSASKSSKLQQKFTNPFDLTNPNLKQQAEMLEQNPARAKKMIVLAGRDPEMFGITKAA